VSLLLAFGWLKHLVPVLVGWLGYCTLVDPTESAGAFGWLLFPRYAPFFIAGMLFYLLQTRQAERWKLWALLLWAYGLSLYAAQADTLDKSIFFQENFSVLVVAGILTGCYGLVLLVTTGRLRLGRAAGDGWLSYVPHLPAAPQYGVPGVAAPRWTRR
jgi:hypothetical protein